MGVLTIWIGKLGRERRHDIPTGAIFGSHDRNGLLDGTNIDIKASDSIKIDMFNWEHSTPKKVDASPHGESHTHNAQHIRHRRLSLWHSPRQDSWLWRVTYVSASMPPAAGGKHYMCTD